LADEQMLPAIFFIFSRAACDDAVSACLDAGVRLTTPEERSRIREICDQHVAGLSDADLDVLGWGRWIAGMEAGLAAHHAGMVPPFKEATEACFAAGLVKVVFATETLAVGINMPARAVVIEKLSKFTGERHQLLTPGEYTQLTGRAGRRGIDEVGYAVVLWSPFVTFEQVANLVSTRTYAISSRFRPTYNMAANLVRRYEPGEAHHLLNLSFAQYQADRDIVQMEARLDRTQRRMESSEEQLRCDRGDAEEYLRLQRELADDRSSRPALSRRVNEVLERFRPGDVLRIPGRRNAGPAVVLSATPRRGSMQLKVLTAKKHRLTLTAEDFEAPPQALGRVELPEPYLPNSAAFQRAIAERLRKARLSHGDVGRERGDDDETGSLTDRLDRHPVADCPELPIHRRAWYQLERLERERQQLERQVRGRSASLARQFDQVLQLLESWGYLDGWSLTSRGERLTRIYHEADLVIATALEEGLFDGLDAPSLAGLVSGFTYETRGPGDNPVPWFPSKDVRSRWAQIESVHGRLVDAEERSRLPMTRPLDPGFVGLAHAWATGDDLDEVLDDEQLSGGDFVRNVKQLIDLLRQLGDVAPDPATGRTARDAADRLFRGVVSASSAVGSPGDDPQG
jgi:ATP-dependent RNA helicase HelY